MESLESLHDLLIEELKDLHSAERQLLDTLPVMAEAASSDELSALFESHREETEDQLKRLDQLFHGLDEQPSDEPCEAMDGLVAEMEDTLERDADPMVMDAALIVAAQKIEHYEIAGYGSVRTFARVLGYDEVARLLQTTLDEEEAADRKLTRLAEQLNSETETANEADI